MYYDRLQRDKGKVYIWVKKPKSYAVLIGNIPKENRKNYHGDNPTTDFFFLKYLI